MTLLDMESERRYTIAELADASAAALDALGIAARNGQVRDRPDVRTIRYYATLGFIDPPAEMTGRTARYGGRHLLQVLAVKAVQARGDSLADAQRTLVGASDKELRSAIGPGLPVALAAVPPPALAAAPEGGDAHRAAGHSFWRTSPALPAAAVPAAEPSAEVPESRTAEPGHSSGSSLNPESSRRPSPVRAGAVLAAASLGPHAGDAGMQSRPFVAVPLDAGATLLIEGAAVGTIDTAALRAAAVPLLAYLAEAGLLPGPPNHQGATP
jgi:DNA-binding transcriptional MerR regulator